jgi:4-hydroxy-2-oxoheptanedioate aldolase
MTGPAPRQLNSVKTIWSQGGVAYGAWCTTGSPFVAELIAHHGFHFVGLDAQHGLFGYESLLSTLMAVAGTGATPIVRMPSSDPAWAGKVLDAGAEGIIFPMIETADDAAAAVAACRYHPVGQRSFGPLRAALRLGRDPAEVAAAAACIVMIETEVGAGNVEQIAAVEGVDCIYVGPGDLNITLGGAPTLDPQPGPHADAIEHIRRATLAQGKALGIPCSSAAPALAYAKQGFNFIAVGADTWWLTAAASTAAKELGLGDERAAHPHNQNANDPHP